MSVRPGRSVLPLWLSLRFLPSFSLMLKGHFQRGVFPFSAPSKAHWGSVISKIDLNLVIRMQGSCRFRWQILCRFSTTSNPFHIFTSIRKRLHYGRFKDGMSASSPERFYPPLTKLLSAVPGAVKIASHWLGRSERRPSPSAAARWEPARTTQPEPSPLRRHGYRRKLCSPQNWRRGGKTKKNKTKIWRTNRCTHVTEKSERMEEWLTVMSWLRSRQTGLQPAYCRRRSRRKTEAPGLCRMGVSLRSRPPHQGAWTCGTNTDKADISHTQTTCQLGSDHSTNHQIIARIFISDQVQVEALLNDSCAPRSVLILIGSDRGLGNGRRTLCPGREITLTRGAGIRSQCWIPSECT